MIFSFVKGRVMMDPQWVQSKGGYDILKLLVAAPTDVKGDNGYYVTDLYSCWIYGNLAKMVSERVTKGMQVLVGGKAKLSTWQDKGGNFKAGVTLTVSAFDFVADSDKNDIALKQGTSNVGGIEF